MIFVLFVSVILWVPSIFSRLYGADCLEPRPHLLEENFGPDYPRVMYKRNHNTKYKNW